MARSHINTVTREEANAKAFYNSDLAQEKLYIITIEKCSQDKCEQNILLSQQVSIRD